MGGSWFLSPRRILNPVLTSTAPAHAALLMGRPEPLYTVGLQYGVGPGVYRPTLANLFEETRSQLGWSAEDTVLLANTVVPQNTTGTLYPACVRSAPSPA